MRLARASPVRSRSAHRKKLVLAVALSLFPADYDVYREYTPDRPAPKDLWEIDGEFYRVNPTHLVSRGMRDLVSIWRLYQGGGMAPGHLPDGGGTLDQAAPMMDAFRVMDAAEARLKKDRGE